MTTNAYAAKRAIFDRLAELAGPGRPLAGVQVSYWWPGAVGLECVYGGGVTFTRPGDQDAVDGRRVLAHEVAQIAVHVRVVQQPPNGIRNADLRAEAIGEVIGEALAADPRLAGGASITRIAGGQGDYSSTDTSDVSTLSYRVSVESYLE